MCCFSGPVESVTNTNIFARSATKDRSRQLLAYEMQISAKNDVAMILPIPVPPRSAEGAVTWVSLKDYPGFFLDLKNGFPEPVTKSFGPGARSRSAPEPAGLAVVDVGDFEASFVPSVADFTRLDARFRLPEAAWGKLPAYKDWGFAVFKLKKGAQTIHPMAFEFPRREPKQLFFPTVHIHDGEVHEKATFDHSLYCQKHDDEAFSTLHFRESPQLASQFMQKDKDGGLVELDRHVFLQTLRGEQKNEDTILS